MSGVNFTKEELIDKLRKRLPRSKYFGDLTLENVIYGENGQRRYTEIAGMPETPVP